MQVSPDFLDEVRARLSVSDVVGRSVKLQKRGREYVGLSPFNKEKTPSFTVNDQKGFYHCFSSGKSGDIFGFLMETEGLSFPEAVERLAAEAGLSVPKPTREEQIRQERRKDLYDVMNAACTWFEQQLFGPNGRQALQYFLDRGLDEATIRAFRLGYSLDTRDSLKTALKSQGIGEDQMIAAGLIKQPDDGRPPFDYFRGRVMFPITDRTDRVIAFGARTLTDAQPKYLNSPDTDLFHKGSVLYGIATARKAAFDTGAVIVCEGYMDVIALAQAGLTHAVAPLGTAVTERQIQELWKLAPEPIICLDGDNAGRKAARRAAERALEVLKPGHSLKFAMMPDGEDPDTLVRRGGVAALENTFQKATPLSDLLIADVLKTLPANPQPEHRAGAEKQLTQLAFQIKDETVRGYYLRYFKDKLFEAFRPQNKTVYQRSGSQRSRTGFKGAGFKNDRWAPPETPLNRTQALGPSGWELGLLALLIHAPQIIDHVAEEAATLRFSNQTLDSVLLGVLEASGWHQTLDTKTLRSHLIEKGHAAVLAQIDGPHAVHFLRLTNSEREEPGSEADPNSETPGDTHESHQVMSTQQALSAWRDMFTLQRRSALERDLEDAERAFAEDPSESAWQRLSGLRNALRTLNEHGGA